MSCYGVVADGTLVPFGPRYNVVASTPAGDRFMDVSVWGPPGCGLTTAGELRFWGYATPGDYRKGLSAEWVTVTYPEGPFTRVGVGAGSVCVIRVDGKRIRRRQASLNGGGRVVPVAPVYSGVRWCPGRSLPRPRSRGAAANPKGLPNGAPSPRRGARCCCLLVPLRSTSSPHGRGLGRGGARSGTGRSGPPPERGVPRHRPIRGRERRDPRAGGDDQARGDAEPGVGDGRARTGSFL